jgi:hypothetical protein
MGSPEDAMNMFVFGLLSGLAIWFLFALFGPLTPQRLVE